MPKQYVRTCKSCGNTWYSLVSREQKLIGQKWSYGSELCCSTCDPFTCSTAKVRGNKNVVETEINNLRKCPKCGSSNYVQTIQKFK